jgi:hypothetical protein
MGKFTTAERNRTFPPGFKVDRIATGYHLSDEKGVDVVKESERILKKEAWKLYDEVQKKSTILAQPPASKRRRSN